MDFLVGVHHDIPMKVWFKYRIHPKNSDSKRWFTNEFLGHHIHYEWRVIPKARTFGFPLGPLDVVIVLLWGGKI